jgi:hypothetical protein
MQTAVTLVTAIVLSLVAQSSAAPAPAASADTIEQCAKLLPQGRQYTFVVNGTIDYSGATPVVHGELSLTDDTNDDLTQRASPFAQCFAKVVR